MLKIVKRQLFFGTPNIYQLVINDGSPEVYSTLSFPFSPIPHLDWSCWRIGAWLKADVTWRRVWWWLKTHHRRRRRESPPPASWKIRKPEVARLPSPRHSPFFQVLDRGLRGQKRVSQREEQCPISRKDREMAGRQLYDGKGTRGVFSDDKWKRQKEQKLNRCLR